jgi:hypothetical protein
MLALVVEADDATVAPPAAVKSAKTILVGVPAEGAIERRSFVLRRALVELRSAAPAATLGAVGTHAQIGPLLDAGLAAYVDAVAVTDWSSATAQSLKLANPGVALWRTLPFTSFEALVDATADRAGAAALLLWPPLSPVTPELMADARTFAELFPEGAIPLSDPRARCTPSQHCALVAYQRADTLATVVVARRLGDGQIALTLSAPRADVFAIVSHVGASPAIPDSVLRLAPVPADATGVVRLWLPFTGVSHLIAQLPAAQTPVTERVSVVGARVLSVDEVIARHQAVAARQARAIQRLITEARTTIAFEIPAFPAPVTIESDTTIFQGEGPTELAQKRIIVNGVAFASTDVPRLPLIEPERVAAPPLAITLDRNYRYRLSGREPVGGRDAYVVSFTPVDADTSLFSGRAWIDAQHFALLRVDAVQTNLRGPITSSQQIEEFAPYPAGGERYWLLARSEIRQVYQGAGLTTPIHRVMVVRGHEINPADLAPRRQAAYASPAVMLRETPQGLRYLRRAASGDGGATPVVREVADRATRIRTLAGGVLVDPNISHPLPFGGLNYTDFDFLGTGTQLNAFYAGTYGQFAFNAPSVAGSRWQLTGSGFGILVHYNDRSFRAGSERYEENVEQRPASLRFGTVRPITARTTARVEYLFEHVGLEPASSTAPDFVVPEDQVVHGLRLALETQRAGWRIEGWWNPARRAGWRAWGFPGSAEFDPAHGAFQRFGVNASRPWVLSSGVLLRIEGAWMSGRDLDRFSRYAFGTFENRLRGYPSASIRYERGGALRTAVAWQPGGRLRLDGFADVGLVRDPGFGDRHRAYPGVGAAVEAPGPWSLLLGAEWGYGIEGLNTDGSRGTHVVRLTAYKVF